MRRISGALSSSGGPNSAARVAYAGAGLVGSFRRSTPRQIRRLVERVLTEVLASVPVPVPQQPE